MQGGPSLRIVIDLTCKLNRIEFCAIIWTLLQLARLSPSMKNPERQTIDHEDDVEKVATIRKIRKLMEFWRITPAELRGRPVPVVRSQVRAEIRYRHPVTRDVWDGAGAQPQWLRDALIKEGYTVDELRPGSGQSVLPESVSTN